MGGGSTKILSGNFFNFWGVILTIGRVLQRGVWGRGCVQLDSPCLVVGAWWFKIGKWS